MVAGSMVSLLSFELGVASQDGLSLVHASEELKGDREVVMKAVLSDWRALQYATEELSRNFPQRIYRDGETTIKIKFSVFEGGGALGAERKIVQNAVFHGKRHDNTILRSQILLSKHVVVIAQVPKFTV